MRTGWRLLIPVKSTVKGVQPVLFYQVLWIAAMGR
jgi:hypothetical protein